MGDHEKSSSSIATLTGIIALLMIAVVIAVSAAIYCYRMAEGARQEAEALMTANAMAVAASHHRAAMLEQDRDSLIFFVRYFNHVVGAKPLSDVELNVVRPTIMGDPERAEMDAVLRTFEKDMASINEVLGPDRQVHNYHEAVTVCRELLDQDAN